MDKEKIKKIQKLHSEIQNFKDCYEGNELWGVSDGPVDAERLLGFLIEHPYFQKIADTVKKLDV